MSTRNIITRIFGGAWRLLDFVRKVLHLVLLVIFVAFVVAISSGHSVSVPSSAALVVNIQGEVVEQLSGDPVTNAVNELLGQAQHPETRLRDVLRAIRAAKSDKRIKALVIDADKMTYAGGLSKLQSIGRAIKSFKASGKPVYALGDSYDQDQYYLASMANAVYMQPQGMVSLTGFGIYRDYFKDALDKLKVDWNVFRVGKYKSYVEPYTRNSMSAAAKEADGHLLKVLWRAYQRDVTDTRKLKPDAINNYISGLPHNLAAVQGDSARLALKTGLVDKLAGEHEMRSAVAKVAGKDPHTDSFSQIEMRDYLQANGLMDQANRSDNADKHVGVIVAAGEIEPGEQPPGAIGGKSTAELIRRARNDDTIKAIVLRVDSPGGSAFASDVILRQIQLTQASGKPVIVSMGSVAASGGYWISMAGDKIWAEPTTITGSIGILGMLPTFQRTLAKLGIHSDGVGTTSLSGAYHLDRKMSPKEKKLFQLTINHGYHEFVSKVAHFRHMSYAKVNKIAQGRVWSGLDAKRLGLVDKLGGLQEAIKSAASFAKLGKHYSVRYIKQPTSLLQRLLIDSAERGHAMFGRFGGSEGGDLRYLRHLAGVAKALHLPTDFNDPNGRYAYCFCKVR